MRSWLTAVFVPVEKAIKEGLRPLGYYEPVITFDYQDNAPPARPVLYARVVRGTG